VSIECKMLISLLKLSKEGPVLSESVNKDARLPSVTSRKLLDKLQSEGLVYIKDDNIKVDSSARLKLAVKAVGLGADVEQMSNLLCWQEFEEIAAFALRSNGYVVANNVRFKHAARKWEIDVVGCRKPLVICIDCKHWKHAIAPSALKRIVNSQVERTRALANSLPNIDLKLECVKWRHARFTPTVLSLIPSTFKFYEKVPIVPILQLQDFINQLPVCTESLKFFPKMFASLSHDF